MSEMRSRHLTAWCVARIEVGMEAKIENLLMSREDADAYRVAKGWSYEMVGDACRPRYKRAAIQQRLTGVRDGCPMLWSDEWQQRIADAFARLAAQGAVARRTSEIVRCHRLRVGGPDYAA